MKRLLMAALFGCFTTFAQAQNAPVCGNTETIIETIQSNLGAWPAWIGHQGETLVILFINREKVWIIIAGDDEKACIVAYGEKSDTVGLGV